MAFRLSGKIHWGLCVLLLFLATPSLAQMPLPTGSKIYSYSATAIPEFNADPSQAKPIGVGDVTSAHNLALRIGLDAFSAPVDIYLALYAPAVFPDLFLFRSDGNLTQASLGLTPWKASTTGPLIEGLLGRIPLSILPSCDYAFYLLAAPAGTQAASLGANCYLWVTSVGNLRVLDVSEKAALLFGGDVEGAAAILMALGRDHDIENVAKALLGGRLTQYGEILAATTAIKALESGGTLPSFCVPGDTLDNCRQALLSLFVSLGEALEEDPINENFENVVTAYTAYLASLGYTAEQIHEAIVGTISGGEIKISFTSTTEFPFGGIARYSDEPIGYDNDGYAIYVQFVAPKGQPRKAVFSDLDSSAPKINDVPSTEGMTFPTYYKGTGTARLYYSNPSRGDIQCTLNDVVFVAKVGGEGAWEFLFGVFSSVYPSITSTGDLECRTGLPNAPGQPWRVVRETYRDTGTYYWAGWKSDTYYEESSVKFNKQRLWGNVYSENTSLVYKGYQITEKEWEFDLQISTEAEYKAVIPD